MAYLRRIILSLTFLSLYMHAESTTYQKYLTFKGAINDIINNYQSAKKDRASSKQLAKKITKLAKKADRLVAKTATGKKDTSNSKPFAKKITKLTKQANRLVTKTAKRAPKKTEQQTTRKSKHSADGIVESKPIIEPMKKDTLSPAGLLHIKNNLKPIDENNKNIYAKSLLAQRDCYNTEADLNSFIEKMQRSDVNFKNETDNAVSLQLTFQDKISKQSQTISITIAPHELYIFAHENKTLQHVKLETNDCFLNPKWNNSKLQLTIEKTQDKFFLHQYHAFNFKSRPFNDQEINASQKEDEKEFKISFNNHRQYMDFIFKEEGLSLTSVEEQRQFLYTRNNMGKLTQDNPAILDYYNNKIPCITHKIWVTSDENPVDIPQYYLNWYENSIKHNPVAEGWVHYLWIENKEKLPELAKKLEGHPSIKIMELDKDLPEELITGDLYRKAIQQKQFGKASDVLRLEILNQFGGWYLDTDLELYQSLKPYGKAYDMVVALEPMSVLVCNAFIGSRPSHPVILKGLELINRNLSDNAPSYIKNNNDKGWRTIVETGPALLTVAFAQAGGKIGETDIVMAPMLIYPTPVNEYPRKQVIKPNEPKPAESICGHYWETAWMRKEFGSKG